MGKFYLLRGKAAAGVLTGLFGLTAALCFDPILMPMAVVPLYFAAPVFLAFAAVYAGLLPGAACLLLACLGWWRMLGPAGAACALLYFSGNVAVRSPVKAETADAVLFVPFIRAGIELP